MSKMKPVWLTLSATGPRRPDQATLALRGSDTAAWPHPVNAATPGAAAARGMR